MLVASARMLTMKALKLKRPAEFITICIVIYLYLAITTPLPDAQMVLHNDSNDEIHLDLRSGSEVMFSTRLDPESISTVPLKSTYRDQVIEIWTHDMKETKKLSMDLPWTGSETGELHIYLNEVKNSYISSLEEKPLMNWQLQQH